jgi:hypothetical protein
MALHILNIDDDGTSIKITDVGTSPATSSRIEKRNISSVGSVFGRNVGGLGGYNRFQNRCLIVIHTTDGNETRYEAQLVANQPTWNIGTKAALEIAVSTIQGWIV